MTTTTGNLLADEQLDRALGVVLASAAGDALGAGYEFKPGWSGAPEPAMIGGGLGNFEPGEWTDDTTMAWAILEPASRGLDLRTCEGLTAVARNFITWARSGPADIGVQTSRLLSGLGADTPCDVLLERSRALHEQSGRTAGNGSLMRTGVVALPYLHNEDALADAAAAAARLTHWDELNVEACVLWCCAIRKAVLDAELDVRTGLGRLSPERRDYWEARINEAETQPPRAFEHGNGFVVTALQAAWAAIVQTPVPEDDPSRHLADALAAAVRIGQDTDTVACIAGQLLGARWGASAVPDEWRRVLHGYPGIGGDDLVELGRKALRA